MCKQKQVIRPDGREIVCREFIKLQSLIVLYYAALQLVGNGVLETSGVIDQEARQFLGKAVEGMASDIILTHDTKHFNFVAFEYLHRILYPDGVITLVVSGTRTGTGTRARTMGDNRCQPCSMKPGVLPFISVWKLKKIQKDLFTPRLILRYEIEIKYY